MDSSRLKHYLYLTFTLPPGEVFKRAGKIIGEKIRIHVARNRARLLGTHISEAQLWPALIPSVANKDQFIKYLRSNNHPAFFINSDNQAKIIINCFEECLPWVKEPTVAVADQVCQHIFDLLGSGPTQLSNEIDWHFDFKSGHHYNPRTYYLDVRPAFYPGGSDIKVPWELSRGQHFVWLGQAYWYTGEDKYAREFVDQILSWIKQNPPQFGVNWNCTMDVSIRAVNWLWGYHFFKQFPGISDTFLIEFNKSLLAHGRHIINNLEWSAELTSNHYLSNIVGLVYLGILCPYFDEAQHWREFGLHELWREMRKQVYADGVDFEASISYHRMIAEFFLSPIILCQLNNIAVPHDVMERLERMLEFVMHYTKPDGTIPLIGDSDNGRLHRLKVWAEAEQEWRDHRYLLAIGAVLFDRDDFGTAAGEQWEEAFWLWGQKAANFKEKLDKQQAHSSHLQSRVFSEGGLYIMRHDDAYMIIDAGSNGQNGNGGHAHNDVFSFELYVGGSSWIVDPGTYLYTSDFKARNLFRSTAYHNTVMINKEEQNRFDNRLLFMMENDVTPSILNWQTTDTYTFFVGEHDGYARLINPVIHRRSIFFDHIESIWIIKDIIDGYNQYPCQLNLHFAPQLTATRTGDGSTEIGVRNSIGSCLRIKPLNLGHTKLTIQTGWISCSYGHRQEAMVATWDWASRIEFEFAVGLEIDDVSFEQRLTMAQERLLGIT